MLDAAEDAPDAEQGAGSCRRQLKCYGGRWTLQITHRMLLGMLDLRQGRIGRWTLQRMLDAEP